MIDLKLILKGKVVMLCIGNIERGDDGAGPVLAGIIKDKAPFEVIDVGTAPENWTGVVKRSHPDTIIIVDAVNFDGEPGDVKIFSGNDLRSGKISTHDVSPKLLIQYLKESTKARIYVLAIRPVSNRLGEGLSLPVESTIKGLSRELSALNNAGCE